MSRESTGNERSAGSLAATRAIARASRLCRERGSQLTPLRRTLLAILWDQPQRALGAYTLMRRLEAASGTYRTATTVYRSLEFLVQQELAVRVETCNGYLPCPDPGHAPIGMFLLCETCGTCTLVEDPELKSRFTQAAKAPGFVVRRQVVELLGVCERCTASSTRAAARRLDRHSTPAPAMPKLQRGNRSRTS